MTGHKLVKQYAHVHTFAIYCVQVYSYVYRMCVVPHAVHTCFHLPSMSIQRKVNIIKCN